MTTIVRSVKDWIDLRKELRQSIGFVPTMGALHRGHESLVKRSLDENKTTVVSIFVNPTQFNNVDDFKIYPRTDAKDIELLSSLKVDYIFFPKYDDLYPDRFTCKVTEHQLGLTLEGVGRPGHFDGVLTVVMKLLNLVKPTRSYFGEKDYQQYLLIKKMIESFFMEVEIIPCPTVRDADGLALSSRNILLSAEERKIAPRFAAGLRSGKPVDVLTKELEDYGFKVDYIADVEGRRFGAVYLGKVRLIDNSKL